MINIYDLFQKPILEKVIEKANLRQLAVLSTVSDQFELCLAKCRTNSHSVQHENKYRNPNKHCYGETQAHESQVDVNGMTYTLILLIVFHLIH